MEKSHSFIGPSTNDVFNYSLTDNKEINLSKMAELEGRFGYNGGQGCDVLDGPCACGAWHKMDWEKCQDKVGKFYNSLVKELRKPDEESEENSLLENIAISFVTFQKYPYIELNLSPHIKQKETEKILDISSKKAEENNFNIIEIERDSENNTYLLEPNYRGGREVKKLFGFMR